MVNIYRETFGGQTDDISAAPPSPYVVSSTVSLCAPTVSFPSRCTVCHHSTVFYISHMLLPLPHLVPPSFSVVALLAHHRSSLSLLRAPLINSMSLLLHPFADWRRYRSSLSYSPMLHPWLPTQPLGFQFASALAICPRRTSKSHLCCHRSARWRLTAHRRVCAQRRFCCARWPRCALFLSGINAISVGRTFWSIPRRSTADEGQDQGPPSGDHQTGDVRLTTRVPDDPYDKIPLPLST
jgi:hypothetical protein